MPIRFGIEHDKALDIIAHQRSGHHGIMHWLFCQFPQPSAFARHIGGSLAWFNNREFPAAPQDKAVVFGLNLEGDLWHWIDCNTIRAEPKLVVIRDIKNIVASLTKLRGPERIHENALRSLEDYMLFALDEQAQNENNVVVANYPRWHADKEYREELFNKVCGLLDISCEFTDVGKDYVMGAGGGSSFSGLTLPGSKLDVLNRWKDKQFEDVLGRIPDNLLELNREYFGDIYD